MKLNRWDAFMTGMLLVFFFDNLVAHKYWWAAGDAICLAFSTALLVAERIQRRRTARKSWSIGR
jgi:hypothetical protein